MRYLQFVLSLRTNDVILKQLRLVKNYTAYSYVYARIIYLEPNEMVMSMGCCGRTIVYVIVVVDKQISK